MLRLTKESLLRKIRLKRWLVRQFFATRTNARPAREAPEAVTVAIVWVGIVFAVLRREGVERPIVNCVLDCGHVLAESSPVDVIRTRTGHQFVGHVIDGDCVLVVCGVLVALVGDFY